MTTMSHDQRRGSLLDDDNDVEEIPAAITKADQMAWEAPVLRPVKIRFDEVRELIAVLQHLLKVGSES